MKNNVSRNANKTKTFDSEQQMVEFVSQSSEVAMLRLFVIFLEDAPICVVNLVRIFGKSPEEVVGGGCAILFIISKLFIE